MQKRIQSPSNIQDGAFCENIERLKAETAPSFDKVLNTHLYELNVTSKRHVLEK